MPETLRKYNYSRQREVIYRILAATTTHPTAEWIYEHARGELPALSLGTVYRNLQILKDQGRIRELTFGSAQARFDAALAPHHHFICAACGAMRDVFVELPAELMPVDALPGLEVEGCRLEFYGRCEACQV